MTEIRDLETKLRDLINTPRRRAQLMSNEPLFHQLCSALDVLGDTELALDAYVTPTSADLSPGETYLRVYGVLQVLYVQQDALEHIAESLSVAYHHPTELQDIRDIRNDSVGHPSRRGSGRAFNHIVRVTLSPKGFELWTFYTDAPPKRRRVDLLPLIERQRTLVSAALKDFVNRELSREMDHRERFRSAPLVAIFPKELDYMLEKSAEEINGSGTGIASGLVNQIGDAIAEFEQQLSERGELPGIKEAFSYHADPARHALSRLQEHFAHGARGEPVTQADAEAFLFRLGHAVTELRTLAQEIDDSYSSNT
ncbi:MAG: hypothetical protein QJR08_09250 [Bacillota bacterium]|nr:hypothetical protein [Bacillota bacterium]